MTNVPIRIIRRRGGGLPDLTPIPSWLGDPQEVAPCPCGLPPDDECMLIEGDVPLSRWFHMECLDFLEKEMNEEEIAEKREWERAVRQLREEEDEDE